MCTERRTTVCRPPKETLSDGATSAKYTARFNLSLRMQSRTFHKAHVDAEYARQQQLLLQDYSVLLRGKLGDGVCAVSTDDKELFRHCLVGPAQKPHKEYI